MSEKKRKRMEYKRRWIANYRSQRHTEENRSSSEDEQHSSNQTSCESPQSTVHGASGSTPIHNTSELLQFSDMSESIDGAKHTCNEPLIDWDEVDEQERYEYISSNDDDDTSTLSSDIAKWVNQFQIHHNAADALLQILNRHGHSYLPLSARTILKTVRDIETVSISGMEYYSFGFKNELLKNLEYYSLVIDPALNTIEISLNIDGLPLFKSSDSTLWPILCEIHLKPKRVFPVVLTIGPSKPNSLQFLQATINELENVLQHGICFRDKVINVHLKCIVCDAPAKAMVKNIKLYSGYYGCDRCNQSGVWHGRLTYQEIDFNKRTNESFRNQSNDEHHRGISPFCQLDIDMVNQFPIDYMHQACLGVTKRLLLLWIRGKGPRRIKLSMQNIIEISTRLNLLSKFIPNLFSRKPRGLDQVDKWKATEFRQFLIYTGKIVLRGIIPANLYGHFMALSVAISILICKKLLNEHANYARDLLIYFVQRGRELYGEEFLVYNVHSMLHITDDAIMYGGLDNCGAFPFENYLQKLKKMVRSGKRPLTQIVKRLLEMQNFDSMYTKEKLKETWSFKRPNNVYLLNRNRCCQLLSKPENDPEKILCRIYSRSEALFVTPCDSRIIGCYKFDTRYSTVEHVACGELDKRAIMIEHDNEATVLAILHEF